MKISSDVCCFSLTYIFYKCFIASLYMICMINIGIGYYVIFHVPSEYTTINSKVIYSSYERTYCDMIIEFTDPISDKIKRESVGLYTSFCPMKDMTFNVLYNLNNPQHTTLYDNVKELALMRMIYSGYFCIFLTILLFRVII